MSTGTPDEERALKARATLRRAGFRLGLTRRVPLAMLEALASVIEERGQDAGYPDIARRIAGYLERTEGER